MSDEPKIELAIQSLRLALQSIAGYADCMHDEGSGSPSHCTCPVCVARRALSTEDAIDWRFTSYMDYRRNTMPRERDIVEAWKAYLRQNRGGRPGGAGVDLVMSQIIGDDPSVRDWYVATSVIQWLATNCGMCVLEQAGFKYDWDRTRK
jgi:hypothetical protein